MLPLPKQQARQCLRRMREGDPTAAGKLFSLVHNELLHLMSVRFQHGSTGQTQQVAALVHEAWLRLNDGEPAEQWEDRCRFLAAAAEAMRRVLKEQHRQWQTEPPGLESAMPSRSEDLLAIDKALSRLEAAHPRHGELVKLCYFAGLTVPDAAEILQITAATAEGDWAYARAWLLRELQS